MLFEHIKKAPCGAFLTLSCFLVIFVINFFTPVNEYLIVFISVFFGCFFQLKKKEERRNQKEERKLPDCIKEKTYAIVFFIIALVTFSFSMEKLFENIAYSIFNRDIFFTLPFLILFSFLLVIYIEKRIPDPNDDYTHLGSSIIKGKVSFQQHKKILLAWAVRIFFIPLIYSWTLIATANLLSYSWEWNPLSMVVGFFQLGLCLDLIIALCGYVFSSRIFGNKVISTDSTVSGWLVCLICYPPLLSILHFFKQQTDSVIWSDWATINDGWLYWFWCIIICGTWCIYFLSSLNMGFKFSNLSWRGLVNHGAYRYVKHPAYLSKNIYWWAHTVPFVGITNTMDLLRNLAGLSFVSIIYYLRAKTEERHLMQFNEYRAYSEYIDKHGLWAKLKRCWPRND